MTAQEASNQQQQTNVDPVNTEKLMFSPPTLIISTMRDVKGGARGVSEHICGCGITS